MEKPDLGLYLGMPKMTRMVVSVIRNSTEEDQCCMEKCGVLHYDNIQLLTCRAVLSSITSVSAKRLARKIMSDIT